MRCNKDGLTTEAAQERLVIFGYNKLEEKKVHYSYPVLSGCSNGNFFPERNMILFWCEESQHEASKNLAEKENDKSFPSLTMSFHQD